MSSAGRRVAWLGVRPMLAAAVIYAVLSLVFVGQGLFPGRTLSASDFLWNDAPWQSSRPASVVGIGANYELTDTVEVFQPFLRYTRASLPHIPLWNPYISGGRPYLANAQSAIFSPFNIPAYILPFLTSLAVTGFLKLFVGALGGFALGRRLGMRFGGAFVSGLVFAFGMFFVLLLGWPETSIFPIMPWALLAADSVATEPTPLWGCALSVLVALTYFGGHPETTFHVLFALLVFFVFRLLVRMRTERAPPRRLLRPALAFVGSMLVGTAIAAVVIVPFAELLAYSSDYGRRLNASGDYWPRKYLGGLFLHDYWGRVTQQSNVVPFEQLRGWYAGAVTLMLAPVALLIRPTLMRWGVALFALFSVCMVVGVPPVFTIVTKLPGFNSTHNEPMIIYFLLCIGLLAGWGLDELSSPRPLALARRILEGRGRQVVLGVAAVIFLVPFVWMLGAHTLTHQDFGQALKVAWGFSDPPRENVFIGSSVARNARIVEMSSLLQWIVLAGAGLLLIALRLRHHRALGSTAFVAAIALLLVVDLFRANMGYNPAIPRANAVQPATASVRYLQSQRPNRFVGASVSTAFEPLPSDLAMNYHLYDARAYDYPTETRYDTLWRTDVNNTPTLSQPTELASINPASIRALNLMSVADIMASPGVKFPAVPDLRLVYRGPDAWIYRNPQALPRVFVVDHQQTVSSGSAALTASTAAGFDRGGVAVTEKAVPGVAQGVGGATSGTARIVSNGAERIVVDATTAQRGILVLTDVYNPGWNVTVDGRPAGSQQVDYLLRGVALGAGHHRIVFAYQPASFTIGWVVSLTSTLALLGCVGFAVLRRRSGVRPPIASKPRVAA